MSQDPIEPHPDYRPPFPWSLVVLLAGCLGLAIYSFLLIFGRSLGHCFT